MNTKLWQSYHAGQVDAARDRLLQEHLGLVHHVARQVSRTLAVRADFDELVSAGTIGLMTALEGFDASRGLAFSTFAAPRIRGAILDELRKQDHVPRSIRRKTREISAAREAYHARARPRARRSRARRAAGRGHGHALALAGRRRGRAPHSARPGARRAREQRARRRPRCSPRSEESEVEEQLTHEQEVSHLKDAILRLKEQERIVLSLYYFEELKLHEIAKVLELTESRVSQIRSKALSKLRVELKPLRDRVA